MIETFLHVLYSTQNSALSLTENNVTVVYPAYKTILELRKHGGISFMYIRNNVGLKWILVVRRIYQ